MLFTFGEFQFSDAGIFDQFDQSLQFAQIHLFSSF